MIRTQVYLPEDLYFQIASLARQTSQPAAQVIRESLRRDLSHKKFKTAKEALLDIAKHASFQGPGDLSTHHDDYLYGDKD